MQAMALGLLAVTVVMGWLKLTAVVFAPIGALSTGLPVGLNARELNVQIQEDIKQALLDGPIKVNPGETVTVLVAVDASESEGIFKLALSDLSSSTEVCSFEVDISGRTPSTLSA